MSQYENFVKEILARGVKSTDRTGTGTRRLQGLQMRFDLSEGFPMVTTKQVSFGYIKKELAWMMSGSTSQKTLKEKYNCTIWDEWADGLGRLGPVYGAMFRRRPATKIINVTKDIDVRIGETITTGDAEKIITKNLRKYGKTTVLPDPVWCVWVRLLHVVSLNPSPENVVVKVPLTMQARTISQEWLDFKNFSADFYELPGCELVTETSVDDWFFFVNNGGTGLYCKDSLQIVETYKQRLISIAMTETYAYHDTGVYDKIVVPRFYIDQVADAIAEIKKRPDNRRIIIDAWEPSLLPIAGVAPDKQPALGTMALAPCHCMIQFFVIPSQGKEKAKLSLHLYQRSADAALGVPYNIAFYSLLCHLIALECNLDVGEFIWTGGDCHVYENHVDTLRKQIRRKTHALPTLRVDPSFTTLNSFQPEMVVLENYVHGPKTDYKVAI